MRKIAVYFVLACTVVLLAGDPPGVFIPNRGMAQSAVQCPDAQSPGAVELILDNPDEFIGCKVQAEGILDEVESGGQTGYSIELGMGRSLRVWSWAPLEADELKPAIKPMSYFVRRKLSLIGRLVKERSGEVVLEVSSVEELDGSNEQANGE